MTLCGLEIGIPKLSHIEVYVAEKGLYAEAKDIYDYWEKKNWLTKKGLQVKTVEAACNVYNSIAISKILVQRKNDKISVKKRYKKSPIPYRDFEIQLKDNRWKLFRWFILKVRGEKCEVCGMTENLQIHHRVYYKDAMAWEYSCKEVKVVCQKCHANIHKSIRKDKTNK